MSQMKAHKEICKCVHLQKKWDDKGDTIKEKEKIKQKIGKN